MGVTGVQKLLCRPDHRTVIPTLLSQVGGSFLGGGLPSIASVQDPPQLETDQE